MLSLRRAALAVALLVALLAGEAQAGERSVALGLPWEGSLVRGVQLPAEGRHFFTWDPVLLRSPDRPARRWGTDRLVRSLHRVLGDYARAHPGAPRVGIGDLSRPRGGAFGPKHVSHQNGLDVDVYYPRRDRRERSPVLVRQVDRRLAQDLVDRFVRAGAERVFVGPNVGLRGPREIVQALPFHDNHLHVRLPRPGRNFRNEARGHRLRLPPGWFARVRAEDGATLATSFGSSTPAEAPFRRLQRGEVGIVLRHRSHTSRQGLAPTPPGLSPRLEWTQGGHVFSAVVKLGPGTSRRRQRQALALLRSIRPTQRAHQMLGRTSRGRPIRVWRLGNPRSPRKLLVVGCIHGDECAGTAVTARLLGMSVPLAADLWVIQNLNPDGRALGRRQNGRGVDLNRNFPSEWKPIGRRWSPQYSGSRPLSEPESRIVRRLILRIRPELTIWFHQPQGLVRAWGQSRAAARRYARLAGVPYRSLRWPNGTAPNWQNHRFPGTSSFVVELPAGPLAPTDAEQHRRAILHLAG